MTPELLQRIPRLPNWRWVLYRGAGHPDYTEPVAQLDRYLREENIDVGLSALDTPTGDVARASQIYLTEPPIRQIIETMLYERCSIKLIADALYHKFKEPISENVVRQYRKYFYDTEVLNNYDIAKYYETHGQAIPMPPPVPGHMKEPYMAFQQGVEAELDVQKVLGHMLQQTFFRAQELGRYGWAGDDKVLKFNKQALDVIKTMKDGDLDIAIPEEFNYEIEYPNTTAVTLNASVIDGYDPDDDPNADGLEDE